MPPCLLLTGRQRAEEFGPDYRLAPDAALLVMDHGGGFAFDLRSSFYAVSAITAEMLATALRDGERQAVAAIAARYDADAARVAADMRQLLIDFEQRGVVARHDAAKAPRPAGLLPRLFARLAGTVAGTRFSSARVAAVLLLARASFAFGGWAPTLEAWRKASRTREPRPASAHGDVDTLVRAMSARLPFGGNCKERALASWFLARRGGMPAVMVVGVVEYPLGGHTWCEMPDGAILGDTREHCAPYLPIFRYE